MVLQDNVTRVGANAFSALKLSSITIPDSVNTIGENAFSVNDDYTDFYVDSIEQWLRYDHDATKLYGGYDEDIAVCLGRLYVDNDFVCDIQVPDGVNTIGAYAFCGFPQITAAIIPDSVTTIDKYDFGPNIKTADSGLSDVYYYGDSEQWNAIEIDPDNSCLFSATIHYNFNPDQFSCSKVFRLPAGLTMIQPEAFTGVSVQVIYVPESCTEIGSRAFADSLDLRYVIIPSEANLTIAADALEGTPAQLIYQ